MKCPFGCKIEVQKWSDEVFYTVLTPVNMKKQISDPPNWIYECPVCLRTKTSFKKDYYASPKKINNKTQGTIVDFFPKAEEPKVIMKKTRKGKK